MVGTDWNAKPLSERIAQGSGNHFELVKWSKDAAALEAEIKWARRELGSLLMEMRGTVIHLTLNEDSLSASLAEGIKGWADRLEEAARDAPAW